jgi:hypothetical protein
VKLLDGRVWLVEVPIFFYAFPSGRD